MTTLLTIDADWALVRTPQQLTLGREKPHTTLETVVYDFSKRGRPASSEHKFISPLQTAQQLRASGMPKLNRIKITDRHADILSWMPHADHLICLDAHLDIYSVLTVDTDLKNPGQRLRQLTIAHLVQNQISQVLAELPPAVRKFVAAQAEEGLRDSAWILIFAALSSNPQPLRVTWVVPPHFERALASGFPYPDAQWSVTLNVGARNGIWDYRLISDERRIVVQGTGLRFRSLDIRLTGISGIDWSQLAPQAHLCRTPYLTPTSMTHWAENLAALLVG